MKKVIKAVVFDFDGTLVDTEDIHIDAWKEACGKFGVGKDFDYSIGIGITDKDFADIIAQQYGIDGASLFDEKYRLFFDSSSLSEHCKVYDGIFETIEKLHERSIAMAIASNSLTEYLTTISSSVGLDKYIDCFVGTSLTDTTIRPKPSPDVYANALKILNVDAADAIGIEDSPVGIEAAKSAGLYTFGITNNFDKTKLQNSDLVIDKIDKIFNYIDF